MVVVIMGKFLGDDDEEEKKEKKNCRLLDRLRERVRGSSSKIFNMVTSMLANHS